MKNNVVHSISTTTDLLSVVSGSKPASIVNVHQNDVSDLIGLVSRFGLQTQESDRRHELSGHGYKSTSEMSFNGAFREFYVSRSLNDAVHLKSLAMCQDHRRIGQVLGYPKCCVDRHLAIYAMGEVNEMDFCPFVRSAGETYDWRLNVFSRSVDASLLSHFPCALECEESFRYAQDRYLMLEKHVGKEVTDYVRKWSKGTVYFGARDSYLFEPLASRVDPTATTQSIMSSSKKKIQFT